MRSTISIGGSVVLLVLSLTGCGGSSATAPTNATSPETPAPSPAALSANLSSAKVAPNISQSLSVTGGSAPYSWAITAGTGNLSSSTGSTISYSSATSQNAQVTVTDAAGTSINISVRVSEPATQVAHGGWDGCALLDTGGVKCWGFNDGRLGDGTSTNQPSPVTVLGLESGVTHVAFGYGSGCALMSDKTVKCWGLSIWGTIGVLNPPQMFMPPTTVAGLSNIVELVIGGYHACARDSSGSVYCWGLNAFGQIGNNSTTQQATPYLVTLNSPAISIAAGVNHTCAVLNDHTLQCWGKNNLGQLGDGTTSDQHSPVNVAGLSGITNAALGDFHTCALFQNGSVECWGRGDLGQLGNNSLNLSSSASAIAGLSGVTAIAAAGANTCALTATHLYCWGDNQSGAIGSGAPISVNTPFSTPQTVSNISTGITSFAIGPSNWGSTVAAVVNGQVYTWGLDDNGQLGNSVTGTSENAPALTSPM